MPGGEFGLEVEGKRPGRRRISKAVPGFLAHLFSTGRLGRAGTIVGITLLKFVVFSIYARLQAVAVSWILRKTTGRSLCYLRQLREFNSRGAEWDFCLDEDRCVGRVLVIHNHNFVSVSSLP